MVMPALQKAKVRQTGTDAKTIASTAEMYMIENGGDCPSVEQLVEARVLSDRGNTRDAWDNDFL